mgnify:FL=1|nr:MAG TPA: Protein of unknown function (DUF2786) [Caudoviricetes sp.]
MNKNEAIEKINKLFNLANNSGATEGEKQNALEMVNKLAKKYNIGVEKKREYEYICYEFKKYDKKFVFHILTSLGYYFSLDDNFFYVRNDIPFNFEAFKTFYKATIKVYEVHLRYMKTNNAKWDKSDSIEFKRSWIVGFATALRGIERKHSTKYFDFGYHAFLSISEYAKAITSTN